MKRRDFLRNVVGSLATASITPSRSARATEETAALARKLPRWRGFNLLEKFTQRGNAPYVEDDFKWIADWGFDFVRLPCDYRCWTEPRDPYQLKDSVLQDIDQAIEYGQKYKVHVNLNFHRAPGFCINAPAETLNLWRDEEAQMQFDFQWSRFARRYKGIPSQRLSFDLLNEPTGTQRAVYAKVVRRVVKAIRHEDGERLIIADGFRVGREPVFELADLGVAQSTRGYAPARVSHHKASWVGGENWPEPTWPLKQGDEVLDRAWLYRQNIAPWKKLESAGVGIHVGEWGVYRPAPYQVALAWMRDNLSLWKEAGWGWALWNLRGSFGIVDSQRTGADYVDFHGHQLDRKMLQLLQQS